MDWRGVGSNPAGDIYFDFEFVAPSPFRTGQQSHCKWNQACPFTWGHSCFRTQIRLIIQGFVYSYLLYSFKIGHKDNFEPAHFKSRVKYQAKSRKYQGVFEVKSRVKTWQVRGIWSQQLEHKQVPLNQLNPSKSQESPPKESVFIK